MSDSEASVRVAEITARGNLRVAVTAALVGGLIGAGSATAVGWFEYWSKKQELDIEMAKLSLNLLAGEYDPDGERNPIPARRFAIQTLVNGTGAALSDEDLEIWATNGETPRATATAVGVADEIDQSVLLSAGLDYSVEVIGSVSIAYPWMRGDVPFCVRTEASHVACGWFWSHVSDGYCLYTPARDIACGQFVERTFDPDTGNPVIVER